MTEVQTDIGARETMTETRGRDRVVEVLVGRGNHELVARVRNIRHTVVLDHLLLHEMETVGDITRALTAAMVDMVEVPTT